MGMIEKELIDLFVNEKEVSGIDLSSLEELEKTVKDYQALVENGVAKPRGYNLLTIDGNVPVFEFNHSDCSPSPAVAIYTAAVGRK